MKCAPFSLSNSSKEVEEFFLDQFAHVSWIGEIDLDLSDYETLCQIMGSIARSGDERKMSRVPPAVLLTSMVFCARFTEFGDDEKPSFWRPYAQTAWGLEEADQAFQNEGRRLFRQARAWLEDDFDFVFPHKLSAHDQDVVGGIYMHAILPSYLEDDFAKWLFQLWTPDGNRPWEYFAYIGLPTLTALLRTDSSLQNVRRRLRHFVEGTETAETAARLVQSMAQAALWAQDEVAEDEIRKSLSGVERSVWGHLSAELRQRQPAVRNRRARARLPRAEWLWNLEENCLSLRIRDLHLPMGDKPDRVIWMPIQAYPVDYGSHYASVDPWKTSDGWEIDPVTIETVESEGFVGVVDEQDQPLCDPLPVAALPKSDIVFFRPLNSSSYALLIDEPTRITDGEWIASMVTGVEIKADEASGYFQEHRQLAPLKALEGHTRATRCRLRLPVNIIIGEGETRLRARRDQIEPQLIGDQMDGLLPDTMPVFVGQPSVVLPHDPSPIHPSYLRLVNSSGSARLMRIGDFVEVREDTVSIPLEAVIGRRAGVYTLELYRNRKRLLPEPIRYAVLPPTLHIKPPDVEYCDKNHLPSVLMDGVDESQIIADAQLERDKQGSVVVTWHEPFSSVRLQLVFGGAQIPLTWAVRWRHAWIEPAYADGTLRDEDLEQTELHICGAPSERYWLQVGDSAPRLVHLNARGLYETPIGQDQICQMIREYHGGRFLVTVSNGKTTWDLFTFVRPDVSSFDALPDLTRTAILLARHVSRLPARRARRNELPSLLTLLALPARELDGLPESTDMPRALVALKTAREISYAKLPHDVMPFKFAATLQLPGEMGSVTIETDVPPIIESAGSTSLVLTDPWNGIPFPVNITWRVADTPGKVKFTLQTRNKRLLLCSHCGKAFVDIPRNKILHRHSRPPDVRHIDLSIEHTDILATLEADSWATFDLWQPDFSTILDRDKVRTYRIIKEAADRHATRVSSDPDLYSRDGYTMAVAEWTLNMGRDESRESLEWLTAIERREASARLYKHLSAPNFSLTTPSLRAAILLANNLTARDDDAWYSLDRTLVMVAIVYRAAALNIPEYAWMRELFPHDTLHEVIERADHACPRLLAWAFAWVEIFYRIFPSRS